ncbi:hypothetical protein SELMODRAFT_171911 [Selaginella moellendorffii]|uniref:Micro-fibrillar-associated protein 1 C-terminal domain-containing protein n=1 Tax=Selaginella moellendorffii TaxID=88036 RepID=D8RJ75_SELML|nr:microfibrillar-associated protein 1A [Selaginella moellendorffii]EFJ27864.1 hypothetical protein SELMODRAFT_171911 [Selaginella moellendorffii]|eukprot:XP_002971266.1 microfibrillar-associated protein 1A [Selaginella moellendorffii]
MSVSAGVTDVAIAVREKLRGKIGQTKVQRYWPGKKPEWAAEEEEEEEEEENFEKKKKKPEPEKSKAPVDEKEVAAARPAARAEDDPRLRRLAESRRNRDEAVARHREIRQAEIVSTRQEEKSGARDAGAEEVEDEEAVEERRKKNRERILQKQKEEEEAAAAATEEDEEDGEEEEDEEDEEEEETDSEDELGGMPMMKPTFVRKSDRETIAERERLEAEEIAMMEDWKKKLELRKIESKHLLVEEIRKEEEREKNKVTDTNGDEVNTDDETNGQEEYEAWKAREIARIKRERDEKENANKEKEEIERLRKMSEEERKEYDRKNPKEAPAPKKKWKYMQKYYHKGVFFMSDDKDPAVPGGNDIYKRDYSEPTGEDKLNKSILPKVMQVKNFGRSGRVKWTDLVNEDTTRWDTPWSSNDKFRAQYNNKMAGMNKPIEKPRGTKKMKRSIEEMYKV